MLDDRQLDHDRATLPRDGLDADSSSEEPHPLAHLGQAATSSARREAHGESVSIVVDEHAEGVDAHPPHHAHYRRMRMLGHIGEPLLQNAEDHRGEDAVALDPLQSIDAEGDADVVNRGEVVDMSLDRT